MTKYSIGDTVTVTKPGKTYSTYDKMFRKAGFKDQESNSSWPECTFGEIFWIGKHGSEPGVTLLALRHEDGRECLINEDGVELTNGYRLTRSDIKNAMSKMRICEEWKTKLAEQFAPFEDDCIVSKEFIEECYENANGDVRSLIKELYPTVFIPVINALPLVYEDSIASDFDTSTVKLPSVGMVVKGLAGDKRRGIPKELRGRAILLLEGVEVVVETLQNEQTLVYFKNKQ